MRIDSHQHFWHFSPQKHAWISDEMAVIRHDFLPEDLEPILSRNNFDGCVLVQVEQNEQEGSMEFLRFADLYDFIKGVVGWVDLRAENIVERLQYFKKFPKMKGFRHIVQGEAIGFMQQKNFVRGVREMAKFGYTYDILIYPTQLKDVLHLVRECPENKFVIDHLAKPYIKDKKVSQWSNYMHQIGKEEQVYCKISGMITESDWQNWQKADFHIYLDVVLEAFGTDRLMFGSDWPVCLVAGNFEQVIDIVESYFARFSANEKAKIFGENAMKFYSLS
jgi:L-fuconolactonase